MIFVDKENLLEELKKAEKIVAVIFWSYDCMSCELLNPYLLKLSKIYKNEIIFLRIDIQKNPELIKAYNINSIPTILFFNKIMIVDKIEKVKKKYAIEKKIRDILKNYI